MNIYKERKEKLKKLIIENPDLPIRFFAGESSSSVEWEWNEVFIESVEIEEVVVHSDFYMSRNELGVKTNEKYERIICVKIDG